MGLFNLIERNKSIILLVCALFVLCYPVPVEAKTNEETYQEKLAKLKPDNVESHYQLGLWCLQNKLLDQAKTQFNNVLESNPNHKKARQDMDSVIQLEKDAKIAEIIKKYGPYKGVLDKAGATKENLPWEKAREKETKHFIVKTNLSVDALNDICCLLECAYFTYQDIFGFDTSKEKLRVLVAKNREEFKKIYYDLTDTNTSLMGVFIHASYLRNKSGQDHLLSFYDLSKGNELSSTLLHECTHYAMELVRQKYNCSQSPRWLDEGWATYCESSKLEGKRLARGSPEGLVTNVINQKRLLPIKDAINKQSYIKLNDFINLSSKEYNGDLPYAQGWSLVYFLFNGQGGKYKTGLQAYMEAWKKCKMVTVVNSGSLELQDKATHFKLFEECMGVSIDKLEKEWKEYILKLK